MLKKCSYEDCHMQDGCYLPNNTFRDAMNLLCKRKDAYSIVISDVHIPDMDGFELLERIRLEMDLPVILMSADNAASQVRNLFQLGASDYVLKLIRMELLQNLWIHAPKSKLNKARETEILKEMANIQEVSRRRSVRSNDGCSSYGENLTSINRRKDDKGPGDNSFIKKDRIVWAPDLHLKFLSDVDQIVTDISPKKILDLMNMPWLTREDVAARLQKYRLYLSRFQRAITYEAINYSHPTSGDSTASVGTQYSWKLQRDVSNDNYRISFYSLPLNYHLELGNYESDQEGSVSMPVAASRKSSSTDVSDFWNSRDSLSEFSDSCQFLNHK